MALFASEYVFNELCDVALRPRVVEKFGTTQESVEAFLKPLRSVAIMVAQVPRAYQLEADPDDEHYINIAIASGSQYVVSRDRHLLALMDDTRESGHEFQTRFPSLRVVEPVAFLEQLRATES